MNLLPTISCSKFRGNYKLAFWLLLIIPCICLASKGEAVSEVGSVSSIVNITVVSPNGGEQVEIGQDYQIRWLSLNLVNVKIEYSPDNGSSWEVITNSTPNESRQYIWNVEASESNQCLVRISDVRNPAKFDVSDNSFIITEEIVEFIELTSPNGGENWEAVTTQQITWTSENIESVKIEYTTDNGGSWNEITNSVTASTTSYNWTVPNIESDECLIKISNAQNPNLYDLSDSPFSISYRTELIIAVTSPSANVEYIAGRTVQINWESNLIENIKIDLTTDNGISWINLAPSVQAVDGNYLWEVNNTPSSNCRIQLQGLTNSDVNSRSGLFSILTYDETFYSNGQLAFYAGNNTGSYKLIGLPGNTQIPLANVIEGEYETDWRAFWDNGQNQDYLVEYTESESQFTFRPGIGFWIISKNGLNVNQVVDNVSIDNENSASIDVHTGWNIISNPFNRTVIWKWVKQKNAIVEDLWKYQMTFSNSESFDPYEGYYYYHNTGSDNLSIPYIFNTGQSLSPLSKSNSLDEISIRLMEGDREAGHGIIIGSSRISKDGYDRLDRYAPPDNMIKERIVIRNDSLESSYKYLHKDFRYISDEVEEYIVEIKKERGVKYTLVADGEFYDKSLFVQDMRLGNYEELIDPVELGNTHDEGTYQLLLGNKNDIKTLLKSHIPEEFRLYQNYPNPYNAGTVIRFSLPYNEIITLEVFNILGERIAVLIKNEVYKKGLHEYLFNNKNLSTGVYLTRLVISDRVLSSKMLLIK